MAALVVVPLVKAAAAWLLVKLLTPRTHEDSHAVALDTTPLDELASTPAPSTAAASTTAASVPVAPTPAESLAITPREAAQLEALAGAESASAQPAQPASAQPASVPAQWVPVTPAQPASPAELPAESSVPLTAAEQSEALASAASAARALYQYVMRTPSASRDRVRMRTLQAAMGGVTVDGLLGRESAARIRELTGLRIPGLS